MNPPCHSLREGADTITWLATLPDDGPTGGVFLDRRPIEWQVGEFESRVAPHREGGLIQPAGKRPPPPCGA